MARSGRGTRKTNGKGATVRAPANGGGGSRLGQALARRRGKPARPTGAAANGGPGPNGAAPAFSLASDHPCFDCAQCCKYVAIEIDAPTTNQEYDYLLWYLVHPGISVFVDWEGAWFVKFDSRCTHLQPNGMCGIYETRPVICREFDFRDCERHLKDEPADKWLFESADAFVAWFAKQRPKAYQRFRAYQAQHRKKRGPRELLRVNVTALPPPPPLPV